MCKYCDELEVIYAKKENIFKEETRECSKNEKTLAVIFDMETKDFFKRKAYLSVKETKEDWADIKIKYCPFCGKKLTRKNLTQTIKAIMEYKMDRETEKELKSNRGEK